MEIDMSPAKAEAELLELIRGRDSQGFDLSIVTSEGRWTVSTKDLDSGVHAIGEGEDFREAWFDQKPAWARGAS